MAGRRSVRAIVLRDDSVLAMKRDKFGTMYYTLIGGGIELGEDPEAALRRELREEAGLEVGAVRPVFFENDGNFYGPQYIYLCEYKGGEPVLSADTDEAQISAMGKNVYQPMWLPLRDVPNVPFRSSSVAEAMLDGVAHGFPETPRELAWKPEVMPK